MEIKASLKYARISSKKVRDLGRLLRGKSAMDAVAMMKCIQRKSARMLASVLSSAIANAENNNNLSASRLVVSSVQITDGPVLKRFIPAARGSAHPIRKRTSHINVSLKEVEKR